MAYAVKVDDREFRIAVRAEASRFIVEVDGIEHTVKIVDSSQHGFTMIVDQQPYTIVNNAGGQLVVNDEPFTVSVADEQVQKIVVANTDTYAKKELVIKAPMPGLVLEVMVAEGDSVTCGQGLFIVEAMKMQNEMKTPREGIVKQVFVDKGQTINSGDTLITIE
jgi:biotin carboxyl carrier protein